MSPAVSEPAAFPPDSELLRRFVAGRDEGAFDEIVQRHLDLVYAAALRQLEGDHASAQDVAQGVFVELVRKAQALVRHPTLSGWLYTTTRLKARSLRRSEGRRIRREHQAQELFEIPHGSPARAGEPSWVVLRQVLDEAMGELSESDRLAVILRHFESRSYHQVGLQLGLSPNAARMRVDRALERLRARLARRGIDAAMPALAAFLGGHAVQAAPVSLAPVLAASAVATWGASISSSNILLLPSVMALKTKLVVTGIVASMIAVPWIVQMGTARRLREELAGARDAVHALTLAEAEARQAAERMGSEVERLRASTLELFRLRNEVGTLREKLRAATVQTVKMPEPSRTGAGLDGSEPRKAFGGELEDLGSATAERAAVSLIWAATEGHADRIGELLELPANVPETESSRHYAHFADLLARQFRTMEFTGLNDIQAITNGVMRLNLRYLDLDSGRELPYAFFVRRHESGWKVMVEGEAPEHL